jgi:NADH/NAD ratio-sensing transcriptional regulator Rex
MENMRNIAIIGADNIGIAIALNFQIESRFQVIQEMGSSKRKIFLGPFLRQSTPLWRFSIIS